MPEEAPQRAVTWAPIVAGAGGVAGAGLSVAGVFLLAGTGWALLAAALPCFAVSVVIMRGLRG